MRKDRDNIARQFRRSKKNGQVPGSASHILKAAEIRSETKRKNAKSFFRLGNFAAQILHSVATGRAFSVIDVSRELLAQFAAKNFARGRLWDAVNEVNFAWLFVVREPIRYEGTQFLLQLAAFYESAA